MTDSWRKIPQRERPYDAYHRGRYLVPGCDHAGPYCKCDPPFHLRPSTPAEEAIAVRHFGVLELESGSIVSAPQEAK